MELKRAYPGADLWTVALLIVPYGIETEVGRLEQQLASAFNCTLWNWNKKTIFAYLKKDNLLIVPYGIET